MAIRGGGVHALLCGIRLWHEGLHRLNDRFKLWSESNRSHLQTLFGQRPPAGGPRRPSKRDPLALGNERSKGLFISRAASLVEGIQILEEHLSAPGTVLILGCPHCGQAVRQTRGRLHCPECGHDLGHMTCRACRTPLLSLWPIPPDAADLLCPVCFTPEETVALTMAMAHDKMLSAIRENALTLSALLSTYLS